jgi:hypothetical protein
MFEEIGSGPNSILKRRTRVVDPNEPIYYKLPPEPIPLAWAPTFENYTEEIEVKDSAYTEMDILNSDLRTLVGKLGSKIQVG